MNNGRGGGRHHRFMGVTGLDGHLTGPVRFHNDRVKQSGMPDLIDRGGGKALEFAGLRHMAGAGGNMAMIF